LFFPAKSPLKYSNASLSFFKRTCPSKEATSLIFAYFLQNGRVSFVRHTTLSQV
jgi:hypothetical protein